MAYSPGVDRVAIAAPVELRHSRLFGVQRTGRTITLHARRRVRRHRDTRRQKVAAPFWVGAADGLSPLGPIALDDLQSHARDAGRPTRKPLGASHAGDRRRGRRRRLPLRPRLRQEADQGILLQLQDRDGDLPHRRPARRAARCSKDPVHRCSRSSRAARATCRSASSTAGGWPRSPCPRRPHAPRRGRFGGAPAARGRRCTFLVNVWLNHVPWGADAKRGGESSERATFRRGAAGGFRVERRRPRRAAALNALPFG